MDIDTETLALLCEGSQWVPYIRDGVLYSANHEVIAPAVIPGEALQDLLEGWLNTANTYGKKGVILRVSVMVGQEPARLRRTVRVMITDED